MSIFTEVVNDLKGLYPDLVLDPSGKSARKSVTTTENLVLYEERDFAEWEVVEKESGNITIVNDMRGATKLIVMEFVSTFKEFKQEAEQKETNDNVKPDGYETSSGQAEIVDDIEEKKKILEALENGEIKKPESKHTQRAQKHEPSKNKIATAQSSLVIPENVRSKQISALTQEDIKNYLCPTASDQETYLFLQLCQARNLNPFLNEAYLIKFGNKATMVVGKETFTRRAEQHPQFDGFEAGIIVQSVDGIEEREGTFILKNETLLGGYSKVYRKDRTRPTVSKVPLAEYDSGQSLWKTKPATMIRKVALVQALRESFACELSGMYDASEMNVVEAVYEVQA